MLAGCQRSNKWWRQTIRDGADHDHPTRGLADQRQERLSHRELTINIDRELCSEPVQRNDFQWPRQTDAGVIHEDIQAVLADMFTDRPTGPRNLIVSRKVHNEWSELAMALGLESFAILEMSDTDEDVKATSSKRQGNGATHARRRACDERMPTGANHADPLSGGAQSHLVLAVLRIHNGLSPRRVDRLPAQLPPRAAIVGTWSYLVAE